MVKQSLNVWVKIANIYIKRLEMRPLKAKKPKGIIQALREGFEKIGNLTPTTN